MGRKGEAAQSGRQPDGRENARQRRLAMLGRQYLSGKYKPDLDALASALLRKEPQLFGFKKPAGR